MMNEVSYDRGSGGSNDSSTLPNQLKIKNLNQVSGKSINRYYNSSNITKETT